MIETKKILILCAYYTDSNNANGICCRNIAEEFVARGKCVWVISSCDTPQEEKTIKGVRVVFVPTENYVNRLKVFRQKHGIWNKIKYMAYRMQRNIKLLPIYPNNSPSRSKEVFALAQQIVDREAIDTVVGTYRPYESIYASIRLKKKYRANLKVMTYHLDLLTKNNEWSGMVSKIMKRQAIRAVKKERDIVDAVLVPENYFRNKESDDPKLIPVGFPLYVKKQDYKKSDVVFDSGVINFVYIGSLDKDNRNPCFAISFVDGLSRALNKKIVLHIWGRLWDAETKDMVETSEAVLYHGTIDNKYVQDVLEKCDILLNVSNKLTYDYLPSKIFQYFVLGKPIVNILQEERDCSRMYFDKYGKVFNYCTYLPGKEQIDAMADFISGVLSKSQVSPKSESNVFERFTPAYICKKIESPNA